MPRNPLEEKLEAITRNFVLEIVAAMRGASFADVAGLQLPAQADATRPAAVRPSTRTTPTRVTAMPATAEKRGAKPRQTADVRAQLADRVVSALEHASEPMGVRALASELGIAPDLLAAPLRELRAAGRIAKHGEKRATTYSVGS
jgi:hypothetical protein